MKRIKRFFLALMMICLISGSCGCWNYKDIEEAFVVLGAGASIEKSSGDLILSAEVAKSLGEKDVTPLLRVETVKGQTLFDAARNAVSIVGSKMYWGHALTFIISEDIAKDGIIQVLDFLNRQTQIRSQLYIAVAPNDALPGIYDVKDPIHQSNAQHLDDLFESYENIGIYSKAPLYSVMHTMTESGGSLLLPVLKLTESITGQIITAEGAAAFRGQKMVGKLTADETHSALILKQELKNHFPVTLKRTASVPNTSLEIIRAETTVDSRIRENQPELDISVKMEGDIVELQSTADFISKDNKKILESAFAEMLKTQLTAVIKKAQSEFRSDIFGFGTIVHIQQPGFWDNMGKPWHDVFADCPVSVSVKIRITDTSLSKKPVEVEE